MPVDRVLAAQMALYAMCPEDMFGSIKDKNPHGTPQLNASLDYGPPLSGIDWEIAGEIRATDSLGILRWFQFDQQQYFYGFLLRRRTPGDVIPQGSYIAMIRGTMLTQEWLQNAEVTTAPFPLADGTSADVHFGFYNIFKNMVLVANGVQAPIVEAIAGIVGNNLVTVVGHSLGAALATYLTYKLTTCQPAAPLTVQSWLFASPNPGLMSFRTGFSDAVSDAKYLVVDWTGDAVPKLPLVPYVPLANVFELTPENVTESPANPLNLACNHNLVSYAKMLDPHAISGDPIGCFAAPPPPAAIGPAAAVQPAAVAAVDVRELVEVDG